jgi:hypothetical protein
MFSKQHGSKGKLMVDKEAPHDNPGAGIDFRALELEIDGEIDSLFVPMAQRAGVAETVEEAHDCSGNGLDNEKGKSSVEPEESIDFGALQAGIDQEIDSLFVPAAKSDLSEGLVHTGNLEQQQTIQSRSVDSDVQKRPVAQNGVGQSPKSFETATSRAKYDEATPPDDTFDSEKFHLHELPRLIEIFNAAYLSLDWEFSRENIQKFIAVLNELEPFASRSSGAKSVLRIMDAILKRLVDRPHAVNSRLVQLIRDSQGLLAHLLLMESETGPNEKKRLKNIVERFQELRRRALAVKAEAKRPRTEEIVPEALPPAHSDKPQPVPEALPSLILSTTFETPIDVLRNLIEKSCRSLSENLEITDTELARLRQIEITLRKTPALVQIADRLNVIGGALKDQADILRDTRGEMQAQRPKGIEPVAEKATVCEKTGTPVRREDICLIASYGKCLALPASRVLKVARSPGKKGLKILERGYATLTDFRQSFRGIKSGVLGEWTQLPAKELKSYRFEPLDQHSPDWAETNGPMAVLTSDGQAHRIIFGEMVHFISDAEIGAGPPTEGFAGSFESKSHICMPVFDPSSPFSMPDQLSSKGSKADTRDAGDNQWRPES